MSRAFLGTAVLVLLVFWLASCGQPANTVTSQPPSYFRIVDAVNSGSTYAYAPSIIVKDGRYHVFFCSMSVLIPTWDAIRYTTSTDGKTWSTPQIMVLPSWENGMDLAACDPSLVFYQG